jgi:hypothetical protein
MRAEFHFYLLNEHFSQEHADANHQGEESENNRRHEWEDELALTNDISNIKIERKGVYTLSGELPDGENFSHDIANMILFEVIGKDGSKTILGCSESILDAYEEEETGDVRKVKVFMKDFEPMANPVPGIYVSAQEFPKPLVF